VLDEIDFGRPGRSGASGASRISLLWWGSNLEMIWRMHVVTKDRWAADSCWDDVRIGWSYSMASSSTGAGAGEGGAGIDSAEATCAVNGGRRGNNSVHPEP
jgi:hypothetical protein